MTSVMWLCSWVSSVITVFCKHGSCKVPSEGQSEEGGLAVGMVI